MAYTRPYRTRKPEGGPKVEVSVFSVFTTSVFTTSVFTRKPEGGPKVEVRIVCMYVNKYLLVNKYFAPENQREAPRLK